MVRVVAEVDQNDLARSRRLVLRDHLQTGGPIIGPHPAGWCENPNRGVGRQCRQQFGRIVRNPGVGRRKRRTPEDSAVGGVGSHHRILPSFVGVDTLSG